jgi:hypothetical protein
MNETNLAGLAFMLNDLDLSIEAIPMWDSEIVAIELQTRDGYGKIVFNLETYKWEVVD